MHLPLWLIEGVFKQISCGNRGLLTLNPFVDFVAVVEDRELSFGWQSHE
jgi:hypothetical protein